MKDATQMKPREEKSVIKEDEGAAIRQDIRAEQKPAQRRKPRPSIAELQDRAQRVERALSYGTITVAGGGALFAFMWLVAAY